MEIKAAAVAVSSRPEFLGASALNSVGTSAQTASPANDSSASKEAAAIYVSPAIRFDQLARMAVIYYRDADTGETRDQIPPKRIVEEYRRNGGRNLGEFAKSAAEKVTSPLETNSVETKAGGDGKSSGSTSTTSSSDATTGATFASTTTAASSTTTDGGAVSSTSVSPSVASSAGSSTSGSVVSLTV